MQASPNSAQAHFLKARLAWMTGDLPAVEREVDRAEELGFTQQPLARLKGLLLSLGTRKSEAELILRHELDTSQGADREVAEALVRMYMESFRLMDATVVLDRWMKAALGMRVRTCFKPRLMCAFKRVPRSSLAATRRRSSATAVSTRRDWAWPSSFT